MFSVIKFVFTYWWIIALLGAGTVALAWYSGVQLGWALLQRAWELAKTKPGIAVVCLAAGIAAGSMADRKDDAIDRLRSENAALNRDMQIARDAKADADKRAAQVEAESAPNDVKVDALERELAELRSRKPEIVVVPGENRVIVKEVVKTKTKLQSCPANDEAIKRLKEIR